ncbi:Ankyrin repeats (3 copies) [Novipirellula galeiformis]|uniref:Ankyrin repeats (3 copies) n=1 Tax=Novipirellula galeiformis TaxID=2528004 RepID=A0A5C6CLM0_9BACT|nr:ankyrin repeat domain-containing protein [Novipirellula galeiformis]TWU24211.1 Ankyrin repeats (3 copies) [Novipirellula galeiformis]
MNNSQRLLVALCLTLPLFSLATGCAPATQHYDSEPPSKSAAAPSLPTHQPKFSDDAYLMAALDGNMQVIDLALTSGTELNTQNERGHNALHLASFNGHTDAVNYLLSKGMKVDERDGEGKSALIHAASGDFADTVEVLIKAGADVNLKDETEGFTALMMAAAEGQMDVVNALMQHGADKTMTDVDGDTAEVFARNNGHFEIADRLADNDETKPE